MKPIYFIVIATVTGITATLSHAETVRLFPLPEPVASVYQDSSFSGGGTIAMQNNTYGADTTHWNPGFRTAVSGNKVFISGWTWNNSMATAQQPDGFITKLDADGGAFWTRHMRDIMGTPDLGWIINDIAAAGGVLYVGGQRPLPDGRAFVASLDTGGNLIEYTLIEGVQGAGPVPWARVNALDVQSVDGQTQVFLIGDLLASSMQILPRRVATPESAATFQSLAISAPEGSTYYSDVFVLRLNTDLSPNWGTTLGFQWSHNHGTAVTADTTGNIFVALKFEDPDRRGTYPRFLNINYWHPHRRTVTAANPAGTEHELHDWWGYVSHDFWPGSWSIVLKLDTSLGNAAAPVRAHFTPNPQRMHHHGAHNRITGLKYHQGSLFAGGAFKDRLRPESNTQSADFEVRSMETSGIRTYDVFLARLNPANMNWQQVRVLHTPGNSHLNQLVASEDSLFIAGLAGGPMTHTGVTPGNNIVAGSSLGGRPCRICSGPDWMAMD